MRPLVCFFFMCMAACSGSVGGDSLGADTIVNGARVQLMPLRGGLVHPRPTTPEFTYFGGPVLPSVKIVEVAWRGDVRFAAQLGNFYGAIAQSEYFDLLAEYATPDQSIGRGSFAGLVTDTTAPEGATVDDLVIQKELARLIHDGGVPANDASTLYVVHFPPGVTLTQAENVSCVDFCAYHGSFRRNGDLVAYAAIPDMGGACAEACGGGDPFANTTWVASHELVQAVTDPAIGFAAKDPGTPLAWYDPMAGEIPDACQGTAQIAGYVVQTQWSAHDGKCRFGPSSTGSFVVGVTPSSQMVKAGTSATLLVTTAATGPGADTIALAATGLPEGLTATFTPPSVAPGNSATLTLAASASAPSTVADLTIQGASDAETQSTTARLTVDGARPANDFSLTATPVTQTVAAGHAVTFTVASALTSGNAESIVLGASGLPVGVTASFAPLSISAGSSSTLTITASAAATTGPALIALTGMARSHTHTATVSLDVTGAPPVNDFSLAVTPAARTVSAGSTVTYSVATAVVSGSAQPIVLSVGDLPAGVTGSFSPPSVTAGASSTLTLSAAAGSAPVSDATFSISGVASSGTRSTHAALTVTNAPPENDFDVSLAPSSRSVGAGGTTSFTVSTAVTSGSSVDVAFAISGLPAGVTATFSPTHVATGGSATLTLAAAGDADPGDATLAVTAASSETSHTASASLTVTPPDFALSISPPAQTMTSGSTASYAITTQAVTGAANVSLSVTGLPSGVHGSLSPATVTAGQSTTLTLTADAGTVVAATGFTVRGHAGDVSHSASATVAVTAPPANDFSIALDPASASLPAGMAATFTVSTAVTSGSAQSIALAVTGLPSGVTGSFQPATVTAGQTSALTLTAASDADAGTTTFSVTGTAASGTKSVLANLTVSAPSLGNLVQNGDFEDGLLDHWSVTRGNVTNVNINPHGGARSMKVGRSSGIDSRSVVGQDLAIPATGTTTLDFWMYPRCEDTIDVQYVSIVVGGVFDDLIASCSDAATWQHQTFDISRYRGQTVTLAFEADVDFFAVGSAWFYVDDVVVTNTP